HEHSVRARAGPSGRRGRGSPALTYLTRDTARSRTGYHHRVRVCDPRRSALPASARYRRTPSMKPPLEGRVVALAEGRQLEELAQMLEKEGATALRCPMVSIHDAPDEGPVLAWLRELVAGRFDCVVFFTGEGVKRLLGFAERARLREEVLAALSRVRTLTRG